MTLPRQVLAGECYLVTRRCTQRQFLMRPDPETTQAFEYCLAVAAERFGIELLFSVAMSNHHHTGILDTEGRYPEFLEYFHKLFAKCQNTLLGRWENFWSNEQTSMVRLADSGAILDKLIYVVTNPVKEGLVATAREWPGSSSLQANLNGAAKEVRRPAHFFRKNGPMPESIQLRFRRPPGFEAFSETSWSQLIMKGVRAVERKAAKRLARDGKNVLGVSGVLAQKRDARPKTLAPRGRLSPRIAAKNTLTRIEAIRRNRIFLQAYRAARDAIRDGYNFALFPIGTYWMARFLRVVCDLAPPLMCLP